MKTIIAGSRDIANYEIVKAVIEKAIQQGFVITEVISGHASGVDTMGERWASETNTPLKIFPADWKTHGRSAGPIRNKQMADYGEALIAITNGSRGTENMIKTATQMNLKVFVEKV